MNSDKNYNGPHWVVHGILWGAFMFVFTLLLNTLVFKDAITLRKIGIGIPIWLIGGLAYGYIVGYYTTKEKAKK